MKDNSEFQVGDCVLCLTDGDIGVVTEVVFGEEPYYIEWELKPIDSGYHSTCDFNSGDRVITRLGGSQ